MFDRETLLDGGEWEIGRTRPGLNVEDVDEWLPARVPGNVGLDLLAGGVIEDPFIGMQNEAARWLEKYDWWYRREFSLEQDPSLRTFLSLRGIDYESEIYINGLKLASHTGMFSRVLLDITRRTAKDNILYVRVRNTASIKNRVNTMKCQMGFGWDFAPAIRTMGLWDSVSLLRSHKALIRNVWVDPICHADDYWEAHVALEIDCQERTETEVRFTLSPANFKGGTITRNDLVLLKPGINYVRTSLPIDNPHLWQPWDDGKQNLYNLNAELHVGKQPLDASSARFGLRSVALLPNEDRPDEFWTFEINGERKFARGANWVPADSFPGRVDRERYSKLVSMARDANINMLRVWGGGLKEKQAFYDVCDELGILVWQEFPFSCPHLATYPHTRAFRNLVRAESMAIVHDCKNHPSVVMFCGGNELSQTMNAWMLDELRHVVNQHGGGRPFKPASPTKGEKHNWIIHHAMGNIAEYREEDGSFLSEFGMQAPPARESLERFIPKENLWPLKPVFPYYICEYAFYRTEDVMALDRFIPDTQVQRNARMWTYHNAQLLKIFRYAKQVGYNDIDSFVEASQRMQAQGLQIAIEHIRRRKYSASGVMFWQLNDPWPTISWSVIDYYLNPKLAYHKIKEIYNPLLVSLEYPLRPYAPGDVFEARVFLINDRKRAANDLEVTVTMIGDGASAATQKRAASVGADAITELDPVSLEVEGRDSRIVKCTVSKSGKLLGSNTYDLGLHDAGETPAVQKISNIIMTKLLWS